MQKKLEEAISNQRLHVEDIKNIFSNITTSINELVQVVKDIRTNGIEMNQRKISLIEDMTDLSAISEENAASAEETSAATDELSGAFKNLTEISNTLLEISHSLEPLINQFEID